MNCQELLAALNAFVDGETRSAICRELDEHLAGCNPCRIVIDNIRQTITLYRGGREAALPAGLHQRLHALVRDRWSENRRAAACTNVDSQ